MSDQHRPDPDSLLRLVSQAEQKSSRGKLRIFLGMSAGVGKTYAMLRAARSRQVEGTDVVVGLVETHGRKETEELLEGLKIHPKAKLDYKGVTLEEFDLDGILKLRPKLVVVDELAHSNAPGSRHPKRYQDVLELLEAGIDVYTAMNVQHLESRKDLVEKIANVRIRETVPDTVFETADQIEVIDITPTDLLKRLKEGKVYLGDRADRAAQNFFKVESLTALREMALRFAAERVDQDLQSFHELKSSNPWQSNERLMVAVSHSPHSEKLIRATRRLAYSLEAPWIAVHVDTGVELVREDHEQLVKNIALARELNAEVISTTDRDVASALKRIARQKNVTQVLVGRPSKRILREIAEGGTLLDRLVRESWEIDVHVIRQETEPRSISNRNGWKLNFTTGFIPYWNTFWLLVGLSLISGLLETYLGYQAVGFFFLLGVLGVGFVATLGPTIFAASLSAIVWNFFFIPPRLTIAISKPEDVILCFTFFLVAVITGALTNRVREHEKQIREREERTNVLYEVLRDISVSSGKDEFLERVARRVGQVLQGDCGVVLKNRDGVLSTEPKHQYVLKLSEKQLAVAQWCFANAKEAGWSTQTLAQSDTLFLPLRGDNETAGVFVYKPKSDRKLSTEQENLLQSICRQLGLSLERHFNEKRIAEAEKLRDSEHLHQTLLNSISHEMRTPLTAILGSAAVLRDDSRPVAENVRRDLIDEITTSGDRLKRVIENLLDMSRLNSGTLALNREWHDLHDLVSVTVSRVGKSIGQHQIRVSLDENLPLVNIDYRLMEHALSNLISNALAYTQSDSVIEVRGHSNGDKIELLVEDNGPGIPESAAGKVFEKFYRVPGSPTGGTGLGLSLVKSIVELHGGTIRLENRRSSDAPVEQQGARFLIELPLEVAPSAPDEQA